MDLNLKDLENCKKELTAVLTYEELKPHFEKALLKQSKKISIPGFRKGKAPIAMIKKLYMDSVEYGALEDIAGEIFIDYIIDNKIDLIDKGAIKDLDYKPKESLKCVVEFEVRPEVIIENYKNLELTKTKNVIDDSLVEEEINYHKYRMAAREIDGQATDEEYMITVDTQGLDENGEIIAGDASKDMQIYLGNKEMFPEFREGLKGIRENEERIIDTKGADDQPKKIKITCTKVEKLVYPELNEDFFKKVTGKDDIKNEKEFRKFLKEDITKVYEDISAQALKNDLISEVIKQNEITVPDKYVDTVLANLVTDYKKRFPKNHNFKDFNEVDFKNEKRVEAILSTKWFLLREKIAEIEKLEATEEDLRELAEKNAAQYNIPSDKLLEMYKKNEDVQSHIISEKVFDVIMSSAKITEKEVVKKAESLKEKK